MGINIREQPLYRICRSSVGKFSSGVHRPIILILSYLKQNRLSVQESEWLTRLNHIYSLVAHRLAPQTVVPITIDCRHYYYAFIMRISIPAFLLATPLLVEAACRFEFWQYDNFSFGDGSGRLNHAWMVRTDVFGDNMDFPRMIDDFCSIFHSECAFVHHPAYYLLKLRQCLANTLTIRDQK
jgi:hypothetical protein